jgi:hypothetical protein
MLRYALVLFHGKTSDIEQLNMHRPKVIQNSERWI